MIGFYLIGFYLMELNEFDWIELILVEGICPTVLSDVVTGKCGRRGGCKSRAGICISINNVVISFLCRFLSDFFSYSYFFLQWGRWVSTFWAAASHYHPEKSKSNLITASATSSALHWSLIQIRYDRTDSNPIPDLIQSKILIHLISTLSTDEWRDFFVSFIQFFNQFPTNFWLIFDQFPTNFDQFYANFQFLN